MVESIAAVRFFKLDLLRAADYPNFRQLIAGIRAYIERYCGSGRRSCGHGRYSSVLGSRHIYTVGRNNRSRYIVAVLVFEYRLFAAHYLRIVGNARYRYAGLMLGGLVFLYAYLAIYVKLAVNLTAAGKSDGRLKCGGVSAVSVRVESDYTAVGDSSVACYLALGSHTHNAVFRNVESAGNIYGSFRGEL